MDERAFSRVAETYAGRLYAVAYRLLRNRADAEDAVQRALMKAFAARASYSPRWAVSTWLYRVLSNVCIDELRRRRPPPAPAPGHARRPAPRARGSASTARTARRSIPHRGERPRRHAPPTGAGRRRSVAPRPPPRRAGA